MNTFRKLASLLLAVMMLLSMTACSKEPANNPPEFDNFASVLSLPLSQAAPKLNLTEEDLKKWDTAANSYYETGKTVNYLGAEFDITLGIVNIGEEKDDTLFCYFGYTTVIEQDAELSAQVVHNIVKNLENLYGDGSITIPSVESLEENLSSEKGGYSVNSWKIKEMKTKGAKAVLAWLNGNGYTTKKLNFTATIEISTNVDENNKNTGDVSISLLYGIERQAK